MGLIVLLLVLLGAGGGYRLARGDGPGPVLRTTTLGPGGFLAVLDEWRARFYIHTVGDDVLHIIDTRTGAPIFPSDVISQSAGPIVSHVSPQAFIGSHANQLQILDDYTLAPLYILPVTPNNPATVNTLGALWFFDEPTDTFYNVDQIGTMSIVDVGHKRLTQVQACQTGGMNPVVSHPTMHLFLACASGNITQMRDARSGRLLRSINTAGLGDCTSRRLGDDLTGRVFIPGGLALGILDGRTGALVSTLPFQTWCNASFELDGHAGSVVELDPRNGDVLAAPSVVPGTGPPATTVLVLDGHSGAIVRRLRVPENPLALLVNPLTGHLLVASAGPTDVLGDPLGNGTLSVLDMASGDTIRQVEVGLVPGSLFADRRAGRLVVVNYTSNLLSGEPLTRRYPDGWWPHALRWLKHAFGWLPYTAPVVPPPPTNATVTTLDLTKL